MRGEPPSGKRDEVSGRVIEKPCVSKRQSGEMGPCVAAVIALMRIGRRIISHARSLGRQMVPRRVYRVLIPGRRRPGDQYRRNQQEV